jgi:OOP family OmpA-OmpF porin
MKKILLWTLVLFFGFASSLSAAKDSKDTAGSNDPELFSRMSGFYIYNYKELDFNSFQFPIGPGKTQTVEGRHIYVDYYAKEGIKEPSALQIARNYMNAVKAVGGQTVYRFEDGGMEYVTLKVVKDNTEAWAALSAAGNGMYKINVVIKEQMKQDVVANAESLTAGLNNAGKVAVYGIYFDTGKAEIKPESEPTLKEIGKMLKADTKLKLYIVGHTDNAGSFDSNIKLSQARAASVIAALVNKQGVAASRLVPFGAGPTSPVSSNKDEKGRAQNRRVELVAQ